MIQSSFHLLLHYYEVSLTSKHGRSVIFSGLRATSRPGFALGQSLGFIGFRVNWVFMV